MNSSPDAVIRYLRDEYDIRSAVVLQNKHRKLSFPYHGKRITLTLPVSSGDQDWLKITLGQVRAALGPPPEKQRRLRRTLDSMTADLRPLAPLETTNTNMPVITPNLFPQHATLACRELARLRVYLTRSIVEQSGLLEKHVRFVESPSGVAIVESDRYGTTFVLASGGRATTNQRVKFRLPWMRLFEQSAVGFRVAPGRIDLLVDPSTLRYDREKETEVMPKKPLTRTYARADVAYLEEVRERLGMAIGEFSRALGYSTSSVST